MTYTDAFVWEGIFQINRQSSFTHCTRTVLLCPETRGQVIPGEIGLDLPFSNDPSTLLTAAEAYFYLGWSVIPLHGDLYSARPKVPTLPWVTHQHHRASLNDQRRWVNFAGLGIVTGRISQLVVLDFDDENTFRRFKIQYPDLTETRTVRSAGRQLPHLYFKLPDHLHLISQKGQGIDLLSDGRYVVAPPTTINGNEYKIIRGGMPKPLTERDIRRIQSFLTSTTRKSPVSPLQPVPSIPPEQNYKPSEGDLKRLYHHLCQHGGRNEALFRTSLYARDTGWTHDEAQIMLGLLHIESATLHETPQQRHQEARATIKSAFSRPPRRQISRPRPEPSPNQLSNSVREALLQRGMTFFIRTYEGLLHKGFTAGQFISLKQARTELDGIVGRDSIRSALKATVNQQPLFPPVSPLYAVATDQIETRSKTAYLIASKNQNKIKRGRPQQNYQIPSNAALCRILGVKPTSSDSLHPTDLTSACRTRMGWHRELIRRRPGQYARRWLAQRLHVSRRTLDTYNRRIALLHTKVMYFETAITWETIERLPLDEALHGAFLETSHGKRYPALRSIASHLLVEGTRLTLKQQTANFYWYGQEEPLFKRVVLQQRIALREEHLQAFVPQQTVTRSPDVNVHKPSTVIQPKPRKSWQNFHRPLKHEAQEARAQALYDRFNQSPVTHLSMANARRLILSYEPHTLDTALNRLTTFQSLTNPVGLLITLLHPISGQIV